MSPDRFTLTEFDPAYLALYHSGELAKRVEEAVAGLESCAVCPRECGVNRLADEKGFCKTGRYAHVSSAFPHHGEENPLRGWRGSGTIFFSFCNLRCVFCQNYDISQLRSGEFASPETLAGLMLRLQGLGCHNINFVTPEHVVPQMLEGLLLAVEGGLRLPIVYNTSAYDSLHTLKLLDGVVDIYLPDFKFWSADHSEKYLKARDYPEAARAAIREMHRQVGALKLNSRGAAVRGVLVRHLVMPGGLAGTPEIMRFLADELSPDTYVNVMAQYHPAAKVDAENYPEINRRIARAEYLEAVDAAKAAGIWRLDK